MTAYLVSLALTGLVAHRVMGGFCMSAEIIQFIPRPRRDCGQTDFPMIVFRSAVG